ncbi:hypothetical protein D9M68_983950 [compost metagenome]
MTQANAIRPMAVGPDDAAHMMGTTRSKVFKEIAEGHLSSFKLGKRRLILIKEIERRLNQLAKENSK